MATTIPQRGQGNQIVTVTVGLPKSGSSVTLNPISPTDTRANKIVSNQSSGKQISTADQGYILSKYGQTNVVRDSSGNYTTSSNIPSATSFTGGGGSSNSTSSKTGSVYNLPGVPVPTNLPFIAPQTSSQQAQDQSLNLARQNVTTQRDALQRDQNYLLSNSLNNYGQTSQRLPYVGSGASVQPEMSQANAPSFLNVYPTQDLISAYNQPDFRQMRGGTTISNPIFGNTPVQNLSPGQLAFAVDVGAGISPRVAGLSQSLKLNIASSDITTGIQSSFQSQIDTGQLAYSTEAEKSNVLTLATQEYNKQITSAQDFYSTKGFTGQGTFEVAAPLVIKYPELNSPAAIAISGCPNNVAPTAIPTGTATSATLIAVALQSDC